MALTKIGSIGINTGIAFAGVTTITTLNGSDAVLSVGGTVNFNSDVSIGGSVSIGGTLTYEDVTNIDSVGLITARNGIVVGSGITLSKDGDVFFTGIATGNGSGLTALNASNIASGTVPTARLGSGTASSSTFLRGDSTFATVTSTTISNNADDRLITGTGTANTINAEADLTFDGTNLKLTDHKSMYFGTGNDLRIWHDANNSYSQIAGGSYNLFIDGSTIYLRSGDGSSGQENAIVMNNNGSADLYHSGTKKFSTTSTGTSIVGQLVINETGGTAGKGEIAFGESGRPFIEAYDNGNHGSGSGIDFRSGAGDYFLKMNQDAAVQIYYDNVEQMRTHPNGIYTRGIYPLTDNTFSIGSGSERYTTIYATNSSINTSDRTEKNTIIESDLGLDFVNKLKPVSYKWNEDDGKTHYGLIAQDVEETLTDIGKTVSDFGGIHKEDDSPMGLGYSELISPLIKAVQELSAKNDALEAEIAALKG